jgi:hypothetical protein
MLIVTNLLELAAAHFGDAMAVAVVVCWLQGGLPEFPLRPAQ